MPLRDHFRPPVSRRHSWDALFGGWPAVTVQHLHGRLPDGHRAAPLVRLGIDGPTYLPAAEEVYPRPPVRTIVIDLPVCDEYEVRVYDDRLGGSRLATVIAFVAPSNKDRPGGRRAFVTRCAAYLQQGVCVSVVDVVAVEPFNVYAELLASVGGADPSVGPVPPAIYAATLRPRRRPGLRTDVETWFDPLDVGQPLPSLPVWLDIDLAVTLDLEASYEDTCRVLRIG